MKKPLLKYLAGLLIFGSNGVVASFIPLTSAQVVWSRTILGSLFLLLVFAARKTPPRFALMRPQWGRILVSGVSMGLSWVCLFESYRSVGVGVTTLIYYCGPVIVMALSPVIFHERLTFPKIGGILAVILGMLLVNGADAGAAAPFPGLLYAGASAALYAVMIISNKRIEGLSGLELTFMQLAVSFAVVGPYVLATGGSGARLGLAGVLAIVFLGLVNTGVACLFYFSAIHELPAQTVAICSYLDPASALVFSAALLGERMTPVQLAGAALILGGAAFGELFKTGRRKTPQGAPPA